MANRSRPVQLWCAALIGLCLVGGVVRADDIESEFKRANEYYEAKRYDGAIERYLKIIDQGVESSTLYFNLGNAYFKNSDLGHAILYYMKARRLDPSDEDIRHNLEFARRFSPVQMEGVTLNPVHQFLESLTGPYRLNTLGWLSSIIFILFIAMLAMRFGIGIRGGLIKTGIVTALVLTVVVSGLTTFKYQNDYMTERAVIIADETPVRTGPSDQSEIELQGAPGLVVEILAQQGQFYNVLFENKRRGWVNKDLVALI